jgi:hypothetical protein
MSFSFITASLLFLTYVVVDMLYAYYVLCVGRKKCVAAANCSAIIYSLLAYGVTSYSQNILYLIPLATGALAGTFLTVKFEHLLK